MHAEFKSDRICLIICQAFALLAIFAASTNAAKPLRVRVLSYNIHHAEGVDGKLDLERIAQTIRKAQPDLVALQEVDDKTERVHGMDQPNELARLTDMQVVFGRNLELQGGGYGNAVLSRWPILRQNNHALPSLENGEPRGVLVVEVQPPELTTPLVLFATHLDHRPRDEERFVSIRTINDLAGKQPSAWAILAGDLNATPETRVLQAAREFWAMPQGQEWPTIPVAKPQRQIDYVLARPAEHWKFVETRVLEESIASDHRPILRVLELNRPSN